MIRILGIDPGFQRLGLASLIKEGDEITVFNYGLINHERDAAHTWNEHLNSGIHQIVNDFPRLLDISRPDYICAELVPPGRLGANSELVVAAITCCKVIAFQFGIPWKDYGANTIKKDFTGVDKANKTLVRNTVLKQFPAIGERHKLLKKEQKENGEKMVGLPQDVFDAISIAYVGCNRLVQEN